MTDDEFTLHINKIAQIENEKRAREYVDMSIYEQLKEKFGSSPEFNAANSNVKAFSFTVALLDIKKAN